MNDRARELHDAREDSRNEQARLLRERTRCVEQGERNEREALRALLAEMKLHDDLPDSFDLGYMQAWREVSRWLEGRS